jgi:ribosome modulation factor
MKAMMNKAITTVLAKSNGNADHWKRGYEAGACGRSVFDCPYQALNDFERDAWMRGFNAGNRAYIEEQYPSHGRLPVIARDFSYQRYRIT